MKKLAIFDFDGTVVDTITDVAICFNESLRLHGFPQHSLEKYSKFVGGNLETVVSRLLPQGQVSDENISRVKLTYRELYLNSSKPNTKPYPGMTGLLEELKANGVKIAVNSNKGQALLDHMIGSMYPLGYFDAVVGYLETRPSKPDPYGVDMICKACGCTRQDAVYIGDGRSDIDTASNAGIPCVFVTWGQGTEQDQSDARVAFVAHDICQLNSILLSEM